jgi:hypothetical protein
MLADSYSHHSYSCQFGVACITHQQYFYYLIMKYSLTNKYLFMKKDLFMNANTLFVLALLIVLFISCKKEVANQAVSHAAISYTQERRIVLSTVSLNVTVNDAGNNITSDGHGDYMNGSQNVQAVIDNGGNFSFNTNTNSFKAPGRSLNFNFSQPLTIYSDPPLTNVIKSYQLSSVASTVSSFIPLQNLPIGQPECVSFSIWAVTANTINWRALFHAGFDDRTDSTTAFASVTKLDATHWTITSLGNCLPASTPNKAALRSGDARTLYGYYNLPFSFTLTAK